MNLCCFMSNTRVSVASRVQTTEYDCRRESHSQCLFSAKTHDRTPADILFLSSAVLEMAFAVPYCTLKYCMYEFAPFLVLYASFVCPEPVSSFVSLSHAHTHYQKEHHQTHFFETGGLTRNCTLTARYARVIIAVESGLAASHSAHSSLTCSILHISILSRMIPVLNHV